jgi:hypothetical protein
MMLSGWSTFAHLALEYSLLVFFAGMGLMQAAATYNGLRGLLLFPYQAFNSPLRIWPSGYRLTQNFSWGYVIAAVTIVPAMVDFFFWNRRNATGIIEGPEQAGLFFISMVAALGFTLIFGSLINHWRLRHIQTQARGLEALKDITWTQALWRRWARRQ